MRWVVAVILCAVTVSSYGNPPENTEELYLAGNAAYSHGDYTAAAKFFRMAAEWGEEKSQCTLGIMYYEGKGVPKDKVEALKWIRKAAEQGDVVAQSILGSNYRLGDGVPKDYVIADMWLTLVVDNLPSGKCRDNETRNRDELERQMTKEQIAEAQRLAREWKPKKQP